MSGIRIVGLGMLMERAQQAGRMQLHDQAQQAQQATFAAHLEAQQVEKVQIVSKLRKAKRPGTNIKNRKTP